MQLRNYILTVGIAILSPLLVSATAQENKQSSQAHVTTDPSEAVISCDGVMKGNSPVTITNLVPGDHLLTVRKQGYQEVCRTISLNEGQRLLVQLQLDPILGLILIHSDPSGAEVQINGADRGKTPLLISDLPLGKYRMHLSSPGCISKDIDLSVKNRIPKKMDIALTSDSATIILDSNPPGARVTLNGIAMGTTPCTLDRIPEGDSSLELILDGYKPYKQILKLVADEKQKLTIQLKPIPGELTVVSIPSKARIYVNNQFQGEAPVTLQDLEPGYYRIRAELTAHEPLARTVELKRAQKLIEEFRLEGNSGLLELTTEPAGVKVFIDGKEVGVTTAKQDKADRISEPLQTDPLTVGTHQVQLTKKGFFSRKISIEVEKDKTITLHQSLKRRFVPDYEVRTPSEVYRGVLLQVDPAGNVKLEIRSGIIRTIPAKDVRSLKPIRADKDKDSLE